MKSNYHLTEPWIHGTRRILTISVDPENYGIPFSKAQKVKIADFLREKANEIDEEL